MASFREEKREARRQLHEHMSDLVIYLPERDAEPQHIKIRLHDTLAEEGSIGGRDTGWAERKEIIPTVRFLGTIPKAKGLIVTKDMGAWAIERTFPAHDITVDAQVTKLSNGQIVTEGLDPHLPWCGLPAPLVTT